jgi:hypothetical protein
MGANPDREIQEFLKEGLADDRAHELRERIAHHSPALLAENGFRLSIHHQLSGDPAGLGFATVVEMAAAFQANDYKSHELAMSAHDSATTLPTTSR